jgi:hypothetical protein
MHGQREGFLQAARGKMGASLERKRFLWIACAAAQLKGFASMVTPCQGCGLIKARMPDRVFPDEGSSEPLTLDSFRSMTGL